MRLAKNFVEYYCYFHTEIDSKQKSDVEMVTPDGYPEQDTYIYLDSHWEIGGDIIFETHICNESRYVINKIVQEVKIS